jgi:hypothetical protein
VKRGGNDDNNNATGTTTTPPEELTIYWDLEDFDGNIDHVLNFEDSMAAFVFASITVWYMFGMKFHR